MSVAPIGIFDSGVGGLSVYLHLRALLPDERFVYFADTKNVPYGDKTSDEIASFSEQAIEWLMGYGVKLIVVACNSASAHALDRLRAKCPDIPIVGLVPAIKPACALTQTKSIAVLATRATLQGGLLAKVIDNYATPCGVSVHKHFEPTLVPWVEAGMPTDHQAVPLLKNQVQVWADMGVDTLVLGCTHYPFFRPFLLELIAKQNLPITVIDSGLAIAQRVQSLLETFELQTPTPSPSPLLFFSSAKQNSPLVQDMVRTLIGDEVVFL